MRHLARPAPRPSGGIHAGLRGCGRSRPCKGAGRLTPGGEAADSSPGSYEGFTIAAVCHRAQVPPRAVYDRAPSKDALFLAVYEHGMARIRADHQVFDDPARWRGLDATALIEAAVREVAALFTRHQALLRAVVLTSGVHPEVYRRGSVYSRELGDLFTALLRPIAPQIAHPGTDADAVLRTCFTVVFSALVIRVAYGPGFAADPVDNATYTSQLALMSSSYLLTMRQLPAT